jgi:hypothetical protein
VSIPTFSFSSSFYNFISRAILTAVFWFLLQQQFSAVMLCEIVNYCSCHSSAPTREKGTIMIHIWECCEAAKIYATLEFYTLTPASPFGKLIWIQKKVCP